MNEGHPAQRESDEQMRQTQAADTIGTLATGQVEELDIAHSENEANDEPKVEPTEKHEVRVKRTEQWAEVLHTLPQDEKDALRNVTHKLRGIYKIDSAIDQNSDTITAESLTSFEELVIEMEAEYEAHVKNRAEQLAKQPQFTQARTLIRQLTSENIPPEELDTLLRYGDDPNISVQSFTSAVQGVYNQWIIKPERDDYKTMRYFLTSLESGRVPSLEELVEAAPLNRGTIAKRIQQRNQQRV